MVLKSFLKSIQRALRRTVASHSEAYRMTMARHSAL